MNVESETLLQLEAVESRILDLANELRKAESDRLILIRRALTVRSPVIPSAANQKLLLSSDEAAAALSICRKTLYRLTKPRGPIPAVSIGPSGVRYSVEAIKRWIKRQENGG